MSGKNDKQSNDDRSKTLNPNHQQHQKALDEHSRQRDPKNPGNVPGGPKPSSPPGKGK